MSKKFRLLIWLPNGNKMAMGGPLHKLDMETEYSDPKYLGYATNSLYPSAKILETTYSMEASIHGPELVELAAQLIAQMSPVEKDALIKKMPNVLYASKLAEVSHGDYDLQQIVLQDYHNPPTWKNFAPKNYGTAPPFAEYQKYLYEKDF